MATAKTRVAVLISGSGSNLQALIDAAASDDFPAEIFLVLGNKSDAYGLKRAENAGIATEVISHKDFSDREAFDDAMHEILLAYDIEMVCLAGFMRILSDGFTRKWEGKMLNIHPSLLPKYKGLHTHRRALEAGDEEAGCSVHWVTAELDAGPILGQACVPILEGDTEESLAARVLEQEHRLYPECLRQAIVGQ